MTIIRKKDGDEWVLARESGSFAQSSADAIPSHSEDETYIWRALNLERIEYATAEEISRFIEQGRELP